MQSRHRRSSRLPALADRLWRVPLGLASAVFALCGPAHALGHTDFVFYAVLIGLALSAFAVPMGLLGLRHAQGDVAVADGDKESF
jgi:cytochrome c oxidase assembly factor CtaG